MPGLLPRLFCGALAAALGGLVGLLVGPERGAVVGALLGGLLGLLAIVLFDAMRGWRLLRWLRRDRAAVTYWLRYVSSYSTGGSAFAAASEARREQLLANSPGIFADLASDEGTIEESRFGTISVPVTIVDAALSPPFLRRSSQRIRQMLPRARNLTLEQSGHWVALDAHENLLTILRDAAH